MNRLFLFPCGVFILVAACKEVTFQEPQPKGRKPLSSVPHSLQGKYLTITEDGSISKDTVIVTAHGYRFGYFEPADRAHEAGDFEQGTISDTLVLKSYKGYFFLNLKDDQKWLLRVLGQDKNGDITYMALESKDADFNDYLTRLSVEVRIDSMQVGKETVYQIDPTPAELIGLIDKGFFSKVKLKKIK